MMFYTSYMIIYHINMYIRIYYICFLSLDAEVPEEFQGEICFRGRHIMTGYMANPRPAFQGPTVFWRRFGDEHVKAGSGSSY